MRPNPAQSADPVQTIFAALALIAITLIAYAPAYRAAYIWDDEEYVTANPNLEDAAGLARIWIEPSTSPQYYPLVFTTFWIEHHLWGEDPRGYHAVNILLHAASALLVWRVLRRLEVPGAWLAAAIFALHPVHVESVAWITERKNTLSGFFYLLSLYLYLGFLASRSADPLRARGASPGPDRAHQPAAPDETALDYAPTGSSFGFRNPLIDRSSRLFLFSLFTFALALLSKTVACSLPVAILIILWWKNGRITRRDLTPLAPFFAIGLALASVTIYLERQHVGATGAEFNYSLAERTLIAGRAVWFYAGKLLFPANLSFVYPRWTISAQYARPFLLPVALLLMLFALWYFRHRLGRGPFAAALFFVVTLFPALGFFNVWPFVYSFVADHFAYLASLGLIVAIAALLAEATQALSQNTRRIAAAFLVLVLVVLTFRQAQTYANSKTLWTRTLTLNPRASVAHAALAVELQREQNLTEALDHYVDAFKFPPVDNAALNNLAFVARTTGQLDRALAVYQNHAAREPNDEQTRFQIALIQTWQNRPDDAIAAYREAIRLRPDFAEARSNVASLLLQQSKYQDAVDILTEAAKTRPDIFEIQYQLAIGLTGAKRSPEALPHYEEAVRLQPTNVNAIMALADAYVANNRLDRAITVTRVAAQLAIEARDQQTLHALDQRLQYYQTLVTTQPASQPATRPATQPGT